MDVASRPLSLQSLPPLAMSGGVARDRMQLKSTLKCDGTGLFTSVSTVSRNRSCLKSTRLMPGCWAQLSCGGQGGRGTVSSLLWPCEAVGHRPPWCLICAGKAAQPWASCE